MLIGPYGSFQPEIARSVADSGANALWFHGFNREGFESAKSASIHACVEYKTFRANFDEHPELIPIGVDGEPIRYGRLVQGICLSRSEYIDEREAELAEGIRSFDPYGVWLDYLTYAGWFETPKPDLQESCFCENCIREFCEAENLDAASASTILEQYAAVWTAHKCNRIDTYGRRFAEIVRSARPDCLIGAYMCPWKPDEFDGALSRIFAQDYERFADWVDVFTPLIYTKKSGRPPQWSREFLEASNEFIPKGPRIQPILDALDFPESLEEMILSNVRPWGFQLFAGADCFTDRDGRVILERAIARLKSG